MVWNRPTRPAAAAWSAANTPWSTSSPGWWPSRPTLTGTTSMRLTWEIRRNIGWWHVFFVSEGRISGRFSLRKGLTELKHKHTYQMPTVVRLNISIDLPMRFLLSVIFPKLIFDFTFIFFSGCCLLRWDRRDWQARHHGCSLLRGAWSWEKYFQLIKLIANKDGKMFLFQKMSLLMCKYNLCFPF